MGHFFRGFSIGIFDFGKNGHFEIEIFQNSQKSKKSQNLRPRDFPSLRNFRTPKKGPILAIWRFFAKNPQIWNFPLLREKLPVFSLTRGLPKFYLQSHLSGRAVLVTSSYRVCWWMLILIIIHSPSLRNHNRYTVKPSLGFRNGRKHTGVNSHVCYSSWTLPMTVHVDEHLCWA